MQLGVAHEALSGGHVPWRSVTFDVSSKSDAGHTIYGALRETSRFSLLDHQVMAGLSRQLSHRLVAVTELEVSPTHHLLSRWTVSGQLQTNLGKGWNVQTGLRHGEYTGASVDIGTVTAERYWGRYRAAYSLYLAHVAGGGVSGSHRVHGDYYYGKYENSIGVSLSGGREIENVEFRGVLRTGVRSAALTGRQWLTRRWSVFYDAGIHEQGVYYTTKRLGIAVGHRF